MIQYIIKINNILFYNNSPNKMNYHNYDVNDEYYYLIL